jgi:hypothetical protein
MKVFTIIFAVTIFAAANAELKCGPVVKGQENYLAKKKCREMAI